MRTAVRWTLQHGLPRALMRRAARAGDPQARLIVDPSTRDNPFTLHDEVRARGPIVRGRLTYITATHSVVRDVLRSEDFRAGDISAVFPWPLNRVYDWAHDATVLHPIEPPSLLAVEPPEHTRYRRQVSRVFTARAVEGLRPRIQVLAEELLDELAGTGATATVDLVDRYATMLPVTVIAEILGVPQSERAEVLAYGGGAAPSLDLGLSWRQFRSVDASLRGFDAWLGAHLQRLRRSPGEDLLSKLVTLDDDGDRLSETELRATAGLLLAAGFETSATCWAAVPSCCCATPSSSRGSATSPSSGRTPWRKCCGSSRRYSSPPAALCGTPRWPECVCLRANAWSRCSPAPTVIPRYSATRTPSTSVGPTPKITCPSRGAGTTASVRRWPDWRARSVCGRCSDGSRSLRWRRALPVDTPGYSAGGSACR